MPLGARASDYQSCLSALGACHTTSNSQLYRMVSASATGGPWLSKMNDQWFWLLGFEPRPSKDYVLLSLLDFNTWEITASKIVFKFLTQMLRAPPGSFLAELLIELINDS